MEEQDEPDSNHVVKKMLETTLDRICYKAGVTRDFMADLEPGAQKRQLADDITIIVLDLREQFKPSSSTQK